MMETLSRLIDILSYDPAEPMIFSSGLFLYLFLGFTFVYYLLRRRLDARLLFVTLFSYYFYYKSSGIYFFLLAVVTVSDFLLARSIYLLRHDRRRRRWLLALSLGIDLGLLAYFKYTNFFAGMVAQMIGCNFQPWDIFLPVGISFFTFQSMSYTIDVYRGRLKPLHRLLDYAFYVSFFPQLVAGPIVRASEFVPQIRRKLHISRTMFAQGVLFVAMGLLKKAVVSDYISLNFVDRVFDNPTLFSGGEVLLGLYGYSIQIYCDFSGYSDMAIGIALLLGFRFPQNFNAPYKASSVSDFWRRWHISLSSWIRDYVYISLGGNRHGRVRMYLNQMVSMTLCGLWHGASLNFVVWGAMHGLLVCLHKMFSQSVLGHDRHYRPHGWKRVVAVVLTFNVVSLMWVFFRNQDFASAQLMLSQMVTRFDWQVAVQAVVAYKYVFAMILLAFVAHFMPSSWQQRMVKVLERGGIIGCALLIVAIVYLIIQVKTADVQPFIYFQF